MSSAQRTSKHRLNVQAKQFSSDYMDGESHSLPESFIEAKKYAFESRHSVVLNSFDQKLVSEFCENLKSCSDCDGMYLITDMLE